MRGSAGGILAAAAVVAGLLAAGRPLERRAQALRLPPGGAGTPLMARLSEGFSLRRAAGDRAWIDLLIYAGDTEFILDRGARLTELSVRATDHDPSFRDVYLFGGSMLMWQCDRPEEAAALLRRGIAALPSDPRLKMYLAAFTYSRLNDLAGEIGTLEQLAFEPGSPFILKRILANAWEARAKQSRSEAERRRAMGRAIAIWGHVWATSGSEEERRWVAAKCAKIGLDPRRFEKAEK